MKRLTCHLLTILMLLAMATPAIAGEPVRIRLKDGSTWRGEVGDRVEVTFLEQRLEMRITGELTKDTDLYIIVDGRIAAQPTTKPIFKADIISMKLADAAEEPKKAAPSASGRSSSAPAGDDAPRDATGKELGVLFLPLSGTVGVEFRHNEIEAIGKEADKYGPGQIIVLMIDSNGGLVVESEMITEAIWEIKKRHRVIAWVKKAISAGCATAMVCDEIYFMTDGTAGSVTTITMGPGGPKHVPEDQIQDQIEFLVEVAERAGYSEHIARSMKLKKYVCSYDKDPVTGEVTFYGDKSGQYLLSDEESNLTFNSSNAVHCGFAKGIADTEADLAKLLNLPRWHEMSDYGRKLAKDWLATVERAQHDIPLLANRLSYYKSSQGAETQIGAQIQILKDLIRWWDRCPNICMMSGLPEKWELERSVEELRKTLSDMRRR